MRVGADRWDFEPPCVCRGTAAGQHGAASVAGARVKGCQLFVIYGMLAIFQFDARKDNEEGCLAYASVRRMREGAFPLSALDARIVSAPQHRRAALRAGSTANETHRGVDIAFDSAPLLDAVTAGPCVPR